jgi:type II secretion system protein L
MSSSKEQVLLHATASTWSWRQLDRAGRPARDRQVEAGEIGWTRSMPVRVLVDASQCVGLRLELPRISASRQAQALRWAAEEHLASSAEEEHVVAGPRDEADRLCCVVISQARMDALMAQLEGCPVEQVIPDALCLPFRPGRISLAALDSRILARWGDWDFGSFETELVAELLDSLGDERAIDWFGGQLPEALEGRSVNPRGSDALSALEAGLADAPIDLLAGPYASGSARVARSYWRFAAIAAAVVAALGLGGAFLELKMLESRSAEVSSELDAQFARAFPGVTPAGRHREQAERQLSQLRFGQAAGLLDLMNRAAPVIAGQSSLVMDSMSFRDGRLEFVLRAPDAAALENLAARLRALDLNAEVQSLSMDTEGASGRVLLTRAERA